MTKRSNDGLVQIRGPDDFAAAFNVSRETIGRLTTYETLLRQWQKAVNLVAPGTLDAIWHRHFADSAQLLALAPEARSWADFGSGAGLPGLVLAMLMSKPQESTEKRRETLIRVTLIESDTRKCAFLKEVIRQTGISSSVTVEVLPIRAESVTTRVNFSLPEVVCARAVAPLDKLLGLAAPLSPPGTVGLFCKGRGVEKELQVARKTWNFDFELVPSITEKDGRIAVIRQLERKAKD